MASDVHESLVRVLIDERRMSDGDARRALDAMTAAGRYIKEIWI